MGIFPVGLAFAVEQASSSRLSVSSVANCRISTVQIFRSLVSLVVFIELGRASLCL